MLKRLIGKFYFWSIGWTLTGDLPEGLESCIIVAAPHTTNQDYILGLAGFWQRGHHPNIVIKKEAFKGLAGVFLRAFRAVPVDRSAPSGLTDQIAAQIRQQGNLKVVFTPEGTRSYVNRWKKGFYHVALAAQVPIVFVYMDHRRKNGGYGPVFYPTGDQEVDFQWIRNFYQSNGFVGKVPDWSSYALHA